MRAFPLFLFFEQTLCVFFISFSLMTAIVSSVPPFERHFDTCLHMPLTATTRFCNTFYDYRPSANGRPAIVKRK